MKIQILSLVNKKFEISVNSNDRVRTIKDKIQEIDGIPPDQMRLVFGGAQLEDEHLISDYNITENSKIHLVLKLRGGMAMKPNPIKIRIKYFENCSIIKVDSLISIKKLKIQIEQLTKSAHIKSLNSHFKGRHMRRFVFICYFSLKKENTIASTSGTVI